jgi:hypothetical protein
MSTGIRVSDKSFSVDTTSTDIASTFVDMEKVYRFRLAGYTTIVANGSGVINTFIAFDPSSTGANFPEWTTLTALFSEFRMVEFGIQLVQSDLITAPSPTCQPLAVASNLGTAGSPGSYNAIADNADCVLYNWCCDTSPKGLKHVVRQLGLGWSQVTTPTTEPYAGAPGSMQFYGTTGAASFAGKQIGLLAWGVYEFRSRV